MLADYVFDGQLNEKENEMLASCRVQRWYCWLRVFSMRVRCLEKADILCVMDAIVDEGSRSATNKIFPKTTTMQGKQQDIEYVPTGRGVVGQRG
jgi:hypothetical protein